MMTAEHRKPLAAFFLVFAAACLIMGNGLRTQVVEVLIHSGAPPELISALTPDMVLGQSLSRAPKERAAREVPATVQGPVQAAEEDLGAAESPAPVQSLIQSAVDSTVRSYAPSFVKSPARADPRGAAATGPNGRKANPRAAQTSIRPAVAPVPRPAPAPTAVAPRPAPAPTVLAPRPALAAPALDRGPVRAVRDHAQAGSDNARGHTVWAGRSSTRGHGHDRTMRTQSRLPERRATANSVSRQVSPPTRPDRPWSRHDSARSSDRGRDHRSDRSSHDSRRGDSRSSSDRGSDGSADHDRGGHGHSGHRR